jgi:hypothetical protein
MTTWQLGDVSVERMGFGALAPYPSDLVIATKVGPGTDAERGFYNATTAAED